MKELKGILKTMANEEYTNDQKKGCKWLTVYDVILSSRNLVYVYWTPQHYVHNTVFSLHIFLFMCFLLRKNNLDCFLKTESCTCRGDLACEKCINLLHEHIFKQTWLVIH